MRENRITGSATAADRGYDLWDASGLPHMDTNMNMNVNINLYGVFEHPANIKMAERCIHQWFRTIKKPFVSHARRTRAVISDGVNAFTSIIGSFIVSFRARLMRTIC